MIKSLQLVGSLLWYLLRASTLCCACDALHFQLKGDCACKWHQGKRKGCSTWWQCTMETTDQGLLFDLMVKYTLAYTHTLTLLMVPYTDAYIHKSCTRYWQALCSAFRLRFVKGACVIKLTVMRCLDRKTQIHTLGEDRKGETVSVLVYCILILQPWEACCYPQYRNEQRLN